MSILETLIEDYHRAKKALMEHMHVELHGNPPKATKTQKKSTVREPAQKAVRKMSAAGRAAISSAAKARWVKVKKAGGNKLK